MKGAFCLLPSTTDRFHRDGVVGATGDTSHQAFCFHGVTLCIAPWCRQRDNVGLGAVGWQPGDVAHGLGYLTH